MSQPKNKTPATAEAEAEPCTVIFFKVTKPNGNVEEAFYNCRADCLGTTQISDLKKGLERMLGPKDTQNWFYNGELLSNDCTLMSYGINCNEDIDIEVRQLDP